MGRGEEADRGRGTRWSAGDPPSLPWLATAGRLEVLAVIWATVDLERTLADLIAGGDAPPAALDASGNPEDPLLGARVMFIDRPSRPGDTGGTRSALAEPSTEGRVAGFLARNGEGPAGWYARSPVSLDDLRSAAAAGSVALSRRADGPLGDAVLVLPAWAGGPLLILVDPAAVPSLP